MPEIIDRLRQDHDNLARLLLIMDRQVDHLAAGEFTDYRVITDIMHYIVNYPNVHHHPGEDAVMSTLKDRDISSADMIDELMDEHRSMNLESNAILDEMIRIQGNAIFSRDDLVRRLKAYIRTYKAHIDKEEKGLFPAALASLDESDWRQVDNRLGKAGLKAFKTVLDREYNDLYKFILSEDRPG